RSGDDLLRVVVDAGQVPLARNHGAAPVVEVAARVAAGQDGAQRPVLGRGVPAGRAVARLVLGATLGAGRVLDGRKGHGRLRGGGSHCSLHFYYSDLLAILQDPWRCAASKCATLGHSARGPIRTRPRGPAETCPARRARSQSSSRITRPPPSARRSGRTSRTGSAPGACSRAAEGGGGSAGSSPAAGSAGCSRAPGPSGPRSA